MERVGVAELKDKLSTYLRAAESGIEVEVTDRNRPIARIVPATARDQVAIRPARTPFTALQARTYPAAGWTRPSSEVLLEERQAR